jgi:hypothetical protein
MSGSWNFFSKRDSSRAYTVTGFGLLGSIL